MNDRSLESDQETPLPFIAPTRTLTYGAPLRWLKLGFADMKKAPGVSLGYGLAFAIVSLVIAAATWWMGTLGLYLGLAGGFFLVGPMLAIGLYSFSRQIEKGLDPELGYCLRRPHSHFGDLMVFSFVLLIIFMIWARAATALHIFFPANVDHAWSELTLFLGIGTAIGAVFSAIVFLAGAFSLPMIMDRKADAITAVLSSANAVLRNKKVMLLWGSMIVILVLVGVLTIIGLIFVLPLTGHATWHAYRETIDASQWPENL